MDFQEINSPEAKKFIQENGHKPVEELLLSARKFPTLNIPLLVSQIEGRNKAQKKLPTWYQTEKIVYPVKLSMEQCSSEITAAYKASLVSGNILVDLTGGFGVDSYAFSKKVEKVVYVEQNHELFKIAAHNFKVFHQHNVELFNTQAEDFLKEYKTRANWIYLDPARRKAGNKVFQLSDCEPDLLHLKQTLFEIGDHVLLKTSPLLDIDLALKELEFVKEIHVIAVENECKELLFILDQKTRAPEIIAVNFKKNNPDEFRFNRTAETQAEVQYHLPWNYLYEPNAAILKAGAFKSISAKTGLHKLNINSHLYTSEHLFENFPGRSFKILKILKYSKKEIMAEIPEGKVNVTVRNFPDSVELIRRKTGLKDGGERYLFATKDIHNKPVILLTEKIN
jgi:hypothetical protein